MGRVVHKKSFKIPKGNQNDPFFKSPPPLSIGNDWIRHSLSLRRFNIDYPFGIFNFSEYLHTFLGKDSEMLWLENPGNYISPWRPQVITHGPDIFVIDVTLNTTDGPRDCIIAAQFFTKSLTVYWLESTKGNWTDLSKVFFRFRITNCVPSPNRFSRLVKLSVWIRQQQQYKHKIKLSLASFIPVLVASVLLIF